MSRPKKRFKRAGSTSASPDSGRSTTSNNNSRNCTRTKTRSRTNSTSAKPRRIRRSSFYKTMWKKSCVSVLSSVHHGDDEFRPSKLSLELLADLRDPGRIDLDKWNPDLCIRMIQAAVQLDCYMAMKKLILRASR